MKAASKRTIFNDPIYGFISIPEGIIFELIQHPFFQRLRRIKQLGLTHLVYSGAHHTRFHHAIGAMHLMEQAVDTIRSKGHEITVEEEQGVKIAILLHDIGHGPYSHTLEYSIIKGLNHEDLSTLFMDQLNAEFKGELTLALKIFRNKYKKKFLHQLVSSQLDMDRLDYLTRDSFFSGVSEGVIGSDRIIKMLNVANDELAIDAKGIYSIENFIVARRLMYWQVYLHKTVIAAEYLLMNILNRARELVLNGSEVFCTPPLKLFLESQFSKKNLKGDEELLKQFAKLDDYDVMAAIKVWTEHPDFILSTLSSWLVNRKLYATIVQNSSISQSFCKKMKIKVSKRYKLKENDLKLFVFTGNITNSAYNPKHDRINILYRDGTVLDIAEAADLLNISVLSKAVKKYFICYPKDF